MEYSTLHAECFQFMINNNWEKWRKTHLVADNVLEAKLAGDGPERGEVVVERRAEEGDEWERAVFVVKVDVWRVVVFGWGEDLGEGHGDQGRLAACRVANDQLGPAFAIRDLVIQIKHELLTRPTSCAWTMYTKSRKHCKHCRKILLEKKYPQFFPKSFCDAKCSPWFLAFASDSNFNFSIGAVDCIETSRGQNNRSQGQWKKGDRDKKKKRLKHKSHSNTSLKIFSLTIF